MEHRRLVIIIIAIGLLTILGWGVIDALNGGCAVPVPNQCYFLWGAAIASILAGILLIEMLIAYQKARGKWQAVDLSNDTEPLLSNRQIWFRSVARIILTSILLSFPIIVREAFRITVAGVIVGFAVVFLVRGVMNWMPPIEKDQES